MLRAIALPFLVIAAVRVIQVLLIYNPEFLGLGLLVFKFFLQVLAWVTLAVSCHRVFLDDPNPPTAVDGVWLGTRQLRFFMYSCIVGIPLFAATAIHRLLVLPHFALTDFDLSSVYLNAACEFAILVPCQYLSSRLSLTLPAAALGEPMSLAQSWSETRRSGWRLTIILLAAGMVLSLLSPVIQHVLFAADQLWLYMAIRLFAYALVVLFSIAGLSYSYQWFMNDGLGIGSR